MRHRVQTRFRTRPKQKYWHNPQDPEWRRHVGLNATRLQGYDTLRSEWKAVHQACRQWGIADGNDTTPMEVDALMKGKGKTKANARAKRRAKTKAKRKNKGKSKDNPKEGTSDTSNVKCFFCKEKGHTRKDCPKFSAWLAEKKTVDRGRLMDLRFGSRA